MNQITDETLNALIGQLVDAKVEERMRSLSNELINRHKLFAVVSSMKKKAHAGGNTEMENWMGELESVLVHYDWWEPLSKLRGKLSRTRTIGK